MSFAMVLAQRPLSSAGEAKHSYMDSLARAARANWRDTPRLDGPLYIRIVWVYADKTTQDVDNIAKRILDALKGIVYDDDHSVVKCLTEKISAAENYTLAAENRPEPAVNGRLEEMLFEVPPLPDVLYIEVGPVTSRRFVFGPIDGGVL